MHSLYVGDHCLCTGAPGSLDNLYKVLVGNAKSQTGTQDSNRALQMMNLETRYRVSEEGHAELSGGAGVQLRDGETVMHAAEISDYPDLLRSKALVAEAHDLDVPPSWIVFTCTRPLVGHVDVSGQRDLYLGGRHRAAVDPAGERADWMIQQNMRLDASVVLTASREEIVAMALYDNNYSEAYLEDFTGKELWKALSAQIADLRDVSLGDLLWRRQQLHQDGSLLQAVQNNMDAAGSDSMASKRSGLRLG